VDEAGQRGEDLDPRPSSAKESQRECEDDRQQVTSEEERDHR